ncbi:MAG TPA: threonine ammonia-lyase, biosynthetic [Gammaproteobacteria bacterium]|nr:threonine ammonia-lyase, biosynthetic [Gammaproteobacteria bacterium]
MKQFSYPEHTNNANVYDVAIKSKLEHASSLSKRLNNHVYLKREDLQPVFSFKLRGAYNKISQLDKSAKAGGIIAASAGNHAQGVALSAKRLGIRAIIVMPKTTPQIKVKSVKSYDAEVVLHGNAYDEAYEHAMLLASENGMTFIHPYDDPDVIAGQGTVAKEILEQHPAPIDCIFVPVGGGGLVAGVAAYVKHQHPETKIIGVEPEDAACLHDAMKAGERVTLDSVGIFADGVAVRQIGETTFPICQKYVDEVILVSTDEICAAIKDIFDDTRAIAEPAGALAIAGLKKYVARNQIADQNLIAINSGANMNFDRLRHVSERAELGENRETLLAVTIPETPGSFQQFCHTIGPRNITEFNYRYSDHSQAHVFAGIQLKPTATEKDDLINRLKKKNYRVLDLSENEMAKSHIRYMVGGHTPYTGNELIYRFIFPERPGALLRFLTHMNKHWNISMFHYRNHGSAYGRVLIGVQVPIEEKKAFEGFLKNIESPFWDETENRAYKIFLS